MEVFWTYAFIFDKTWELCCVVDPANFFNSALFNDPEVMPAHSAFKWPYKSQLHFLSIGSVYTYIGYVVEFFIEYFDTSSFLPEPTTVRARWYPNPSESGVLMFPAIGI